MDKLISQIKKRFALANIVEQLIYINIAIFLLSLLVIAFASLMQLNPDTLISWFALPGKLTEYISRPWTIITYGFLHADFLHIFFNLLVLFYFGNLFMNFFSKKDFLIYYFGGMTAGAIIYLLSYTYFPSLKSGNSVLMGASAAIMAIVIGIVVRIPNYALHFRFLGPVKIWYIAVILIIIDLIQLPINNTGGHLAHLGGALFGFLLTNYGTGKNNSSKDIFSTIFKRKKEKPLKTVYKNSDRKTQGQFDHEHQKKIDTILDKISKSGYEALSKEEKDFLFSSSKK